MGGCLALFASEGKGKAADPHRPFTQDRAVALGERGVRPPSDSCSVAMAAARSGSGPVAPLAVVWSEDCCVDGCG